MAIKRKQKKGTSNESASKNRDTKVKRTKAKSRAVQVNSRSSKGKKTKSRSNEKILRPRKRSTKKKVTKSVPRRVKPKKTIVTIERKYWDNRKRRTKRAATKSVYVKKTLTGSTKYKSKLKGKTFSIRKKLKQVNNLDASLKSDRAKLKKQSKRYVKPSKNNKGVFIKVVMKQKNGGLRFASHKRVIMDTDKKHDDTWNKLLNLIKDSPNYGNASIIGYEIEDIIDEGSTE